MDELIADFLAETEASLKEIDGDFVLLAGESPQGEALLRIVRALHTIKGACGFLKLPRVAALAHASEGALIRWREGRASDDTADLVRAALAQVRDLLSLVADHGVEPEGDDGRLLAILAATPNALDWAIELAAIRDRLLARASQVFAAPPAPLVSNVSDFRAPIAAAWNSLPLLVEELSASLGKSIELSIEGEGVEISQAALAPVRVALGHLVRNSIGHGIEAPADRRAAGKSETGAIHLAAARDGDDVVIRLSDDGRGLDTARIRNRAITKGLAFAAHAARMTPDQIHSFIFAPGFSTAETLTTFSGRGIGLDAVRAGIEGIGGAIAVQSEPGCGLLITLTIPAPTELSFSPALDVADVA